MSIPTHTPNRNSLHALTIAAALALALPLPLTTAPPAFAGNATEVGRKLDNAAITAEIKSRLIRDERTHALDINVDTTGDGAVLLRGTAPSVAAKAAATALAISVKGVSAVDNALLVAPPGSVAERSAPPATASQHAKQAASKLAESGSEAWITAKVKAALLADQQVKGLDIAVSTDDGLVHLVGVVPSEAVRTRAIELAAGIEGVERVDVSGLAVSS